MKLSLLLIVSQIFIGGFTALMAQTSTTPLEAYEWKRGKTKAEPGYIVLKSGKRVEGNLSLEGSPGNVIEIVFDMDGKTIEFPPAALQSYGLSRQVGSKSMAKGSSTSGVINDSPESMYEWRDVGVVMDKVITATVPRDGYVVLKNGDRFEGQLKLKRSDGVLKSYQIKGESKKKGDIGELERYGYNISEEEVKQANLAKLTDAFYPGQINGADGSFSGLIAKVNVPGKFYSEKIILKDSKGKLSEYTTKEVSGFTQNVDGDEVKYIRHLNTFVMEEFSGKTFQLYRNPFPTSINQFLSNTVKGAVSIGTNVAAQGIVNKDAKNNDYETNMDSIIGVSSTEELKEMRDKLVELGGYSSVEQLNANSDNESLKNNVNAIDLAIVGREFQNVEGGILNKEWIIVNLKTGEKTIVYKPDYKDQIEPMLKGCFEYLSMDRSDQRDYESWSNLAKTVKMLDDCY